MYWTIVMLLVILWGTGMVAEATFGGLIHLLLVFALAAALGRAIQGRQVLGDERAISDDTLREGPSATLATGLFWSMVAVLLVLWAAGMVTSTLAGGFIHVLLAVALAAVLVRFIQGRRTLGDSK